MRIEDLTVGVHVVSEICECPAMDTTRDEQAHADVALQLGEEIVFRRDAFHRTSSFVTNRLLHLLYYHVMSGCQHICDTDTRLVARSFTVRYRVCVSVLRGCEGA